MHADLTDIHIEIMPLCAAKYTGVFVVGRSATGSTGACSQKILDDFGSGL